MADERAKKIKLMLFDVDGVMTDGTIFLFPAPGGSASQSTHEHREKLAGKGGFGIASGSIIEAKGFDAHDGTAFSLARLGHLKTGIITKRISETVALRAPTKARPRLSGTAGQGRRLSGNSAEGKPGARAGLLRR